ncbi:MAG: imidazole glycerol phosphate synthase subunit HisF [Cyanobacteria bacterium]|nr:imidazole glycerol phosphate synthase subunit HisF [Cyanobacteriota bacterium]MDA1020494.1 imidazole glycerol phosphate synthase subunit HisF [Cyanobacteriota bacterium]
MLSKRIIPCLDVDKGRVVKGTNFVEIRDAGDPVELAAHYYKEGADELCFLDITASHEERKATYKIIEATANQVFIPLTVGGGVNSCDDVAKLLQAGADKVGINSGAVRNPQLIKEAADHFGSQCVVIAIDVKRVGKSWNVFVRGGREDTGLDALEWIKQVTDLGAGEILLTSMDADGTKAGYDLDITAKAARLVNIPVIASGGAGNCKDIIDAFNVGADAALLASLLHYKELTIAEIKQKMLEAKISTRC